MTAEATPGDRLATVESRVADACRRAGRGPDEVTIVAVSKTHAPPAVVELVEAGVAHLGENRVQELVAKRHAVDGHLSSPPTWHLVGPLQRNKVNDCIGTGLLVHTVDRRSLVDRMVRHCRRVDARQRVLVQVNVADDPAKHGCSVAELEDLVAYSSDQSELVVEGLMTIPPLPAEDDDPAAEARPWFARLRGLRDELQLDHPELVELSMGMSADLEAAVAEGATYVRVGTALFGPRGPGAWEPIPGVASLTSEDDEKVQS